MKRLLLLFLYTIPLTELHSQQPSDLPVYPSGTPLNSVRIWATKCPVNDASSLDIHTSLLKAQMTTQYSDGLGRPLQMVVKKGSIVTSNVANITGDTTSAKDIVVPVLYDEYGREQYRISPFPSSNIGGNSSFSDGFFKANPYEQQKTFINTQYAGQGSDAEYGYSQIVFERSPLNRVLEQFAPGKGWAGSYSGATDAARHSIKSKYWFNTVKDSVRVWKCTYPALGSWGTYSAQSSPFYAAGTLYKNVTVDESGHQVISFEDKDGHVILKKVQLTATADAGTSNTTAYSGWLCTYYIYDDLGNLRCVIQPEGVKWLVVNSWNLTNATLLAQQCFRYEYDGRNRMVMKQNPGSGSVYIVYDNRDRPVMSQDANMRKDSIWLFTLYDNRNRAVKTGQIIATNSLPTHLNAAMTKTGNTNDAIQYPTTTMLGNATILTVTYYDNYGWMVGLTDLAGLDSNYSSLSNSYLWNSNSANNSSFPFEQKNVKDMRTDGLVTGVRTRVLNSVNPLFLTSITVYDEKRRAIQVKSTNYTGGVGITTTQYSWSGLSVTTVNWQSKLGIRPDTSITITKLTYDDLYRPVKTETKQSSSKVNGGVMPAAFTTVSTMAYDALGQLKSKTLGNRRTSSTVYSTTPLETQAYEYNIRGWLLGINRAYAREATTTDSTTTTTTTQAISGEMFTESMQDIQSVTFPNTSYFGFDLGYDKTNNNLIKGKTYTAAQYTGNIAGMVWKGANDRKVRIYNFTYDNANRLMAANFGQYKSGGFSSSNVNYTVGNLTYDNNGNIKTMNQYGLKTGSTSGLIDQLSYHYNNSGLSNRLLNVIDNVNAPNTTLGDFHYDAGVTKSAATQDYDYDANGNMTIDHNKHLTITYNYLNLPQSIAVTNKGTVTYVYDATGVKLQKKTVEGSRTTVTTYLGSGVYQNDTLQFFGTSEGRVRPNATNSSFVYDYFLKDHLGNTRMVITDDYNVSSPILEAYSYYPFGLQMSGISLQVTGSLQNKYLYNGKELQQDLGLDEYDYGARLYDAQIGRWHTQDPLAYLGRRWAPYNFCYNNPIRYMDPHGMLPGDTITNPNPLTTVIVNSSRRPFASFNAITLDLDGGRYAYGVKDEGTDFLANGIGSSGIYTYKDGTLATQKNNSNYYVSQTAAITNSALADDDPEKYYDPETVPFIVVSMNKDDQLSEIGLKLNGKALIQVLDDNGKVIKTVEVTVRDLGPSGQGKTLELSPAAARLISPQGKEPYRLDLPQNSNSRVYQNAAKRHKAKYGQPFQNKKYLYAPGDGGKVNLRVIKVSLIYINHKPKLLCEISYYHLG